MNARTMGPYLLPSFSTVLKLIMLFSLLLFFEWIAKELFFDRTLAGPSTPVSCQFSAWDHSFDRLVMSVQCDGGKTARVSDPVLLQNYIEKRGPVQCLLFESGFISCQKD